MAATSVLPLSEPPVPEPSPPEGGVGAPPEEREGRATLRATSHAAMIRDAFERIRDNTFIGDQLFFHPTSLNVEAVAAQLPSDIGRLTTDDLFQGIEFQPLNVAESYGRLRFVSAHQSLKVDRSPWTSASSMPLTSRSSLRSV